MAAIHIVNIRIECSQDSLTSVVFTYNNTDYDVTSNFSWSGTDYQWRDTWTSADCPAWLSLGNPFTYTITANGYATETGTLTPPMGVDGYELFSTITLTAIIYYTTTEYPKIGDYTYTISNGVVSQSSYVSQINGSNDSSCCVPYYANILLQDGSYTRAENIKVGDIIFAYNEDTKEIQMTEVLKVSTPIRDHIIKATLENGKMFEVTRNHPVYTTSGWASYNTKECLDVENPIQLETGLTVLLSNDEFSKIISIEYIEHTEGLQCFDFKTSLHTFFSDDVLIHNTIPSCC